MQNDFEAVHTVTDYYDSPRRGIADFHGRPYADNSEDDWSDAFFLQPIDDETFRLAMEDWDIWSRWVREFHSGRTTIETHPALPAHRHGHDEISATSSLVGTLSRGKRFECEDDLPCECLQSLVAVPPDSGLSVG
jgi:hypothetical protein